MTRLFQFDYGKVAGLMAQQMNLEEALTTRRSVRGYQSRPVDDEIVLRALNLAILAPSAHNAQPWRFVWVKENDRRQRLLAVMAERFSTEMAKDGVNAMVRQLRVNESMNRLGDPPVLLLACLSLNPMDKYPDTFRQDCERVMAIQSVSAAVQNLLLAFWGSGLASRWYCAPLFCPELVKKILDLPQDFEPQAFITAGYAASKQPCPPRKSMAEIFLER